MIDDLNPHHPDIKKAWRDRNFSALKIYIAGPMTGLPEFNYPAFRRASLRLRELGFQVLDPSELFPENPGSHPWQYYMRGSLRGLLQCDAILLLNGWDHSRGARLEHSVAQTLEMPIFYEDIFLTYLHSQDHTTNV